MSALSTYGKTTQKSIVVENTIQFQVTDALSVSLVAANPSSGGFAANLVTDAAGGIAVTALDINGGTTGTMSDADKLVFYDAATSGNKVLDGTALKAYIGAGDTLPAATDNQIMVSSGVDNYVSVSASGAFTNAAGVFALANNYVNDSMISGTAAISKSKLAALNIDNNDISAGAGVVYSKLQLNNAIVMGDLVDGPTTAGTAEASKLVQVDGSKDIAGLNNVTAAGSVQGANLLIGNSEWKVVVDGGNLAFQKFNNFYFLKNSIFFNKI